MPTQTPQNDPSTPDLPKVPRSLQKARVPKLGVIGEVPNKTTPDRSATS